MFYYIKDENVVYKSMEQVQHPPFVFDIVAESDFAYNDIVVFSNGNIIPYYGSDLYKQHNGLDKIEKDNIKLTKKVENQEKIVNNVVTSFAAIQAEREFLIANRKPRND